MSLTWTVRQPAETSLRALKQTQKPADFSQQTVMLMIMMRVYTHAPIGWKCYGLVWLLTGRLSQNNPEKEQNKTWHRRNAGYDVGVLTPGFG